VCFPPVQINYFLSEKIDERRPENGACTVMMTTCGEERQPQDQDAIFLYQDCPGPGCAVIPLFVVR
jgi:hypothetical protein